MTDDNPSAYRAISPCPRCRDEHHEPHDWVSPPFGDFRFHCQGWKA